jgi:hypothetical protein
MTEEELNPAPRRIAVRAMELEPEPESPRRITVKVMELEPEPPRRITVKVIGEQVQA